MVTGSRVSFGLPAAKFHPEVKSSGLGKALEFRDFGGHRELQERDLKESMVGDTLPGHPEASEMSAHFSQWSLRWYLDGGI